MNQILSKHLQRKNRIQLIVQLALSTLSIIILISFYISYKINLKKEYKKTLQISNNYKILKLYANSNTNYIKNEPNILGNIIIPKISVNYAFFYTYSEDLLKILPCRFYGDMPPQKSNLCITAHNYNDERFFGKIYELSFSDIIIIEDNYKNRYNYHVYDKFEVSENNLSPLKYEHTDDYILTLITCNNFNNNRIIIKAKQ